MMRRTGIILFVATVIVSIAGPCWSAESMGVDIHGFISQGYLKTANNNFIADSKDGTFGFNETGINFSKNLSDRMRFSMQFFARDFGETDNSEITIDYAYGDYFFKDWLGVRFGQLKAPHGLYNETRDVDMLRNSIFLPQSVYQEVLRNPMLSLQGLGLYGHLDMSVAGGLSYQVMYGTQTIAQNSRMAQALVGYPSDWVDNESTDVREKVAASVVWATPLAGLRLGVSYDNTRMDLNGTLNANSPVNGVPISLEYDKFENIVYSMEYSWRNLMIMAEYMQSKGEFAIDLLGEGEHEPTGWYAGATYRFTDWFELGAYYSEGDKNHDPDTDIAPIQFDDYYYYLKDYCVTARFDINPYWAFKIEYHELEGSLGLSAWDNPASDSDPEDYFDKDWNMIAAKMTVSF